MFEITSNQIKMIIDNKEIGKIIFDEKEDFIVGSHVYVDPSERGKGYSQQLIGYFVEFAKGKEKKIFPTCPVIKRTIESDYREMLK